MPLDADLFDDVLDCRDQDFTCSVVDDVNVVRAGFDDFGDSAERLTVHRANVQSEHLVQVQLSFGQFDGILARDLHES